MKLIAIAVAFAALTASQDFPELPSGGLERVERGEAVQVLTAVEGKAWPRSTVYQFIDATPEQAAAVLADYALQSSYIPRLKTSRVLKRDGANTDVEYVVSIPVYADERSVSRQRVVAKGEEYRVEWFTVVDSLKKGTVTVGSATFRVMTNRRTGKTGTLMIHDQTVQPASMFARVPLVRNKAIEASRDAAAAIRKQVERERTSDLPRMEAQLRSLRSMVVRDTSSTR
jgi:hypothetical protein